MKSITPTGYDPGKRIVLVPGGGYREDYFIRVALLRFYRYGKPELLGWAIENGLPGLMENEHAREIFRRLMTGEGLRGRGFRTSDKLKADEAREKILRRVWFHRGRGLPFYNNPESGASGNECACSITAGELGYSAKYVHEVWKQAGGREPEGARKIVALVCEAEGRKAVEP